MVTGDCPGGSVIDLYEEDGECSSAQRHQPQAGVDVTIHAIDEEVRKIIDSNYRLASGFSPATWTSCMPCRPRS
jgi:hypothetical protein